MRLEGKQLTQKWQNQDEGGPALLVFKTHKEFSQGQAEPGELMRSFAYPTEPAQPALRVVVGGALASEELAGMALKGSPLQCTAMLLLAQSYNSPTNFRLRNFLSFLYVLQYFLLGFYSPPFSANSSCKHSTLVELGW